jgi:hypothetical protein
LAGRSASATLRAVTPRAARGHEACTGPGMRTSLLPFALLALLSTPALAQVPTRDLEGRFDARVTSTNAGRTLRADAEVDVVWGRYVRLKLDGRTIRVARVGDMLYGTLPATKGLSGALGGGLPAARVALRIVDRDRLAGTITSSRESTRVSLRRKAATIDPVAVARAYWGASARYFASEAAWRTWYDSSNPTGDWLYRDEETATAVSFVCGRDDLWHVVIEVNKTTGVVTVTGEH